MNSASAAKAAYSKKSSELGHDLSKKEIGKVLDKLEPHGVGDKEKKFAGSTIGDDKMSAAGRKAFRKFMADDGKPELKTQARASFVAKVAAHHKADSQLGSTLSALEVRRELAELTKYGATKDDEQYARAVYKGKKLSPAAREVLNDFLKKS